MTLKASTDLVFHSDLFIVILCPIYTRCIMQINIPYTKKFLLLSFVVVVSILYLQFWCKSTQWVNTYIWYILGYITSIMYVSHLIIAYGFSKTPYDAQNFFMLGTSVKLLLSAVIIFLYFYIIKTEAVSFILNFFTLYFVYTFFEIKSLLLSLQPHSKSGSSK